MAEKQKSRRKGRLGRPAVWQAQKHGLAIGLRAADWSWEAIADHLDYKERSSAQRAVDSGIRGSQLIPGLRWVLAKRMERLHPRLMALVDTLPHDQRIEAGEMEGRSHMLLLLLQDACGDKRPPGVRDVEALLHRRRPRDPAVDPEREELFNLRVLSATFDMMQGDRYATPSGVCKRVDNEVRRYLLAYTVQLYEEEIEGLRDAWHEIDLALRRRHLDAAHVEAQLERITAIASHLGVIEDRARPLVRQPATKTVRGTWLPTDDTDVPLYDTG